jgi:hypothetical protein
MSITTKMRFTILASALALAAAVPAAFALDVGTTYRGMHTDPGGTPDAPAAMHTQEVMQKHVASGGMMANTGTWFQGMHTDPGGTADAPAGRHTREVMQKNIAPSGTTPAATQRSGVPNY